jgi:predicted SprT family Zn-dependent metalloprotease
MKIFKVQKKNISCDGCSEVGATHKLKFNDEDDSVYMCEICFVKLKKEIRTYL